MSSRSVDSLLFQHLLNFCALAHPDAMHIHIEEFLPVRRMDLVRWAVGTGDARVVHGDVDTAKLVDDSLDGGLDRLCRGNIQT